jgi:NADPH:quinone reductase
MMTSKKMKAVGLYRYLPISESESLVNLELEKPTPTGHNLLVKVKAISVNPVDVKVRAPKDSIEDTPKILGWDVAGIVEQVGSDCTLFQPGDEVYYAGSITRPGGNSEFHLVDERIVGRKPTSLSFSEAAALPLTAITAWEALFHRLDISQNHAENRNQTVLIIGAAGGVGSVAVQLAKWAGLSVVGTASRPESAAWVKKLGADYIVNHHDEFEPQLRDIGFDTVNYILCLNSTDKHWTNMAKAIAPQGKICSIVETDEPLNLTLLKSKSATFVWEFMFTRSMYETDDMDEQHLLLNQLAEMVDRGIIKTTMTECLEPINAANLRIAHHKVEQENMIGKIVLENF